MDSHKLDLPGEDANGDEAYDNQPSGGSSTRRRWPWAVAGVAIALAAVGGGVALAGNMRSSDPAPAAASSPAGTAPATSAAIATTTPSSTITTPPAVTPTASATSAAASPSPSAGTWQTFTSADGKVTFNYPAAWHASQAAGDTGSVDVDVADEAGVVVASLHSGPTGGLGGACEGPVPYTVLDSVELDLPYQPTKGSITPRFTFRALQETDHVTTSYGLTSFAAGQNGTACMFNNAVSAPVGSPLFSFADTFQVTAGMTDETANHKGAKKFPSLDAARAYMQTPEYLNAKRMITSLKVSEG
ncbi:hypothetical protein [Arthrobacter sp. B3I4]|uniref:hypothetical protein n=1 Tax=Arthrobacter sp. B3I4 TaxID=3042267 RepID=UPI00278385DE|nr:hypothetical protein [Arthrobacter sp. B3I4]MDQ0756844.1 hypothetical protein [Arthrobacter sp. B3I4]